MRLQYNSLLQALVISLMLPLNTALAETDLRESKDHPKIPRVSNTTIIGYAVSDYDEGEFLKDTQGNEMVLDNVEGKRTRILYVGPKNLSPLGALRNYQKAFAALGDVEEVYYCKKNQCFSNLGKVFIWRESNRINNNVGVSDSHLFYREVKDQYYWYAKITSPTSVFHVSIYTAIDADTIWPKRQEIKDHPIIYFEIVEVTDFEPTLEVVTADDMSSKINEKGHIALYGINFDYDSDQLKIESDATLEQIAKALQAESTLNLYVVGHSDNQGSLEYNKSLSKRRAESVINTLTKQYGINSARLIAIGIGPTAPLASNKTEDGRALNRRVELVER